MTARLICLSPEKFRIGIKDILRNKRISKKRLPEERPYAVIKNVFKSGHTKVTSVSRVAV